MAYQKQIWENLPSTNTPLSADRLNHIEDGIEGAYNQILLWTNEQPSLTFVAQDITLNSGDYDIYEIFYRPAPNITFLKSTKSIKGYGVELDSTLVSGGSIFNSRRIIEYTNATTLHAQTDTGMGSDNYSTPIYIVGYKTKLFS